MLKTLFKKQMLELNQSFFQNRKKGESRSKASAAGFIVLYAILLIFLGSVFFGVGMSLCRPLVFVGLGWLYFVIMGLIAVALGVFGSVFNTFSSLYQAKDNDLLLSLPIPIPVVLAVRLLGVYVMGFLFGGIVMIPAIVVYAIVVKPSVGVVLCGIIWMLFISIFILTLSCVLGWVVAKISSKLKNKSMITVFVSLAFFAAYYYVYFRANELLQMLIANSATMGMKIKGAAYPLYWLGRSGEGDIVSLLCLFVMVGAAFALVYVVLSRSFLKIVTSKKSGGKTVYQEKKVKRKSANGALLSKEIRRFLSSATYMLNCALGSVVIFVVAVVMVVKGNSLYEMLGKVFLDNFEFVAVIAGFAICLMAAMNDITAPSVSLEGKNIWIVQSLPVSQWQSLKAKLKLHLLFSIPPTLLCSVCTIVVFRPSVVASVFVVAFPVLFTMLCAEVGLAINLKMPNLDWSNESVAVKQSFGVMLAMLIGWCYATALGAVYFFVGEKMGALLFVLLSFALTGGIVIALYYWLKVKGTRIWESL